MNAASATATHPRARGSARRARGNGIRRRSPRRSRDRDGDRAERIDGAQPREQGDERSGPDDLADRVRDRTSRHTSDDVEDVLRGLGHVIDFMPPGSEHSSTPERPTKTPTSYETPTSRDVMMPTPVTWAVTYVKETTIAQTAPVTRAAFACPAKRVATKSGMAS